MFYSQFGEDDIIFQILNKKACGVCVEVGANNGVDDSTSLFFERIGWKCVLIEPNPLLCNKIREVRNSLLYECAASNQNDRAILYVVCGADRSDGLSTISTNQEVHKFIESHGFVCSPQHVQTRTMDSILADAQIDSEIDFISIDVEGHEYEVLEGLNLKKWKPFIMIIEDNSNLQNTTVTNYLNKNEYVKFLRTGVNNWYTHQDNKQLLNIKIKIKIKWILNIKKLKRRFNKIINLLNLQERQ